MLSHADAQTKGGNQQITKDGPGGAEPDDLVQCKLIKADVVAALEFGTDSGGYD